MRAQKIARKPLRTKKVKPTDESKLGFGNYFTDRVFEVEYREGSGWHDAVIKPYKPFGLTLDHSSNVLQYGQAIFEGMKAYYRGKNSFSLFRPFMNMDRMNKSAERLVMPRIDPNLFMDALIELIKLDFDWIPKTRGSSLYIRPTMIGTEPHLGVRPSGYYLFYIILSPVGPYFKTGFNPVKIFVSDKFSRAAPGGVGEAKTAGNYAASLLAAREAIEQGYGQVLWLDARTHNYIEEVGAMNMFFVRDGKTLLTSRLTGTILPGVTRNSVLKLAAHLGYAVEEDNISIATIFDGIKQGRITEAFGTGTAAVITPVGELRYRDQAIEINGNKTGPVARKLYEKLTAIQYGEEKDIFSWNEVISF